MLEPRNRGCSEPRSHHCTPAWATRVKHHLKKKKTKKGLGKVAHACNSSTVGGQGRQVTRSGVLNQPGQCGETLSLLKIQKLAGCGDVHLWSQLLGKLRQENLLELGGRGCSEPKLCHCTPAWATEQDCLKEKKKKARSGGLCL